LSGGTPCRAWMSESVASSAHSPTVRPEINSMSEFRKTAGIVVGRLRHRPINARANVRNGRILQICFPRAPNELDQMCTMIIAMRVPISEQAPYIRDTKRAPLVAFRSFWSRQTCPRQAISHHAAARQPMRRFGMPESCANQVAEDKHRPLPQTRAIVPWTRAATPCPSPKGRVLDGPRTLRSGTGDRPEMCHRVPKFFIRFRRRLQSPAASAPVSARAR
jgi:hypothetical protein